jgi:hypothetical protein
MAYVIIDGDRKVCRAKDPDHCRYHKKQDGSPLKHYATRSEADAVIERLNYSASRSGRLVKSNKRYDPDAVKAAINAVSGKTDHAPVIDADLAKDNGLDHILWDDLNAKIADLSDQNIDSKIRRKDHELRSEIDQENIKRGDYAQKYTEEDLKHHQALAADLIRDGGQGMEKIGAIRNGLNGDTLHDASLLTSLKTVKPSHFLNKSGLRYLEGIRRRDGYLAESLESVQSLKSVSRSRSGKIRFNFNEKPRSPENGQYAEVRSFSVSFPDGMIDVKGGLDAEYDEYRKNMDDLKDLTAVSYPAVDGLDERIRDASVVAGAANRFNDGERTALDIDGTITRRKNSDRNHVSALIGMHDKLAQLPHEKASMLSERKRLEVTKMKMLALDGMHPVASHSANDLKAIRSFNGGTLPSDLRMIRVLARNKQGDRLIETQSDPNWQYAEKIGGMGGSHNTVERHVISKSGDEKTINVNGSDLTARWDAGAPAFTAI